MSVYINGMEMPKEKNMILVLSTDGSVWEVDELLDDGSNDRLIAHAIPVPDHGRLIDADALMLKIQDYIEEYGWETDEHGWHNEKWCAMKETEMAISDAPTIIPAVRRLGNEI